MRPLPNRVDPFGQLHAVNARGLFMGNRGGRFHTSGQRLKKRRWASRQWICCVCEFKDRHREVWKTGYTELFFLDEVTALAAGHRPCFECRRADALAFQARFAGGGLKAGQIDLLLHAERLASPWRSTFGAEALPDGSMVAISGMPFAIKANILLPWSFAGYGQPAFPPAGCEMKLLTPPCVVEVLRLGYRPSWHSSAMQVASKG